MSPELDSPEDILQLLAGRLDKSEAQIAALMEVRKDLFDRSSQLAERLGELRAMIVENSKSIGTVKAHSERTIELVESVQPQNLLKEVKRSELKIDGVTEKMNSTELLMQKVIKDMKELRIEIGKFRGVRRLEEMKEDLAKEIEAAKKLTFDVRRDSDKVESFYSDIHQKMKTQALHDDKLKELDRVIEDLSHDVDHNSVALKRIPDKQLLERFRKETEDVRERTASALEEIRGLSKEMKIVGKLKGRVSSVEEGAERFQKETRAATDELRSEFERLRESASSERILQEYGVRLTALEAKSSSSDQESHFTTVEERLHHLEDQQNQLLQLVKTLADGLVG